MHIHSLCVHTCIATDPLPHSNISIGVVVIGKSGVFRGQQEL